MTEDELMQLVAWHDRERRAAFATRGMRLAHYTSAEAAYKIITGAEIWLRNAAVMNDFSEIAHGIECLLAAWESPAGRSLQQMLDRLKPGLRNELAALFDGHSAGMRTGTYITSLSEHESIEDELGRLSMWRAYGGRAGVALVLNVSPFGAATNELAVYSAPVFYFHIPDFVAWFQRWAGGVLIAEEQLRSLHPETVRNALFDVFRSFALATKHPGFAEEREWRVFHAPVHEGTSNWLHPSIEVIHGTPQRLVKLKLFDDEDRGVSGVAPRELVNRVIIGPCDHPLQVRESMHAALSAAGVENPISKLWMSLIPLRQS